MRQKGVPSGTDNGMLGLRDWVHDPFRSVVPRIQESEQLVGQRIQESVLWHAPSGIAPPALQVAASRGQTI